MKKYTLEKFNKKYEGQRHISCGVNYVDGDKDCFMNASFNQIKSYINLKNKEVSYIAAR